MEWPVPFYVQREVLWLCVNLHPSVRIGKEKEPRFIHSLVLILILMLAHPHREFLERCKETPGLYKYLA